MNLIFKNKN